MEFRADPGTDHVDSGKFWMLWFWCHSRDHCLYVGSHLPQTMRRLMLFVVELYWRLTNAAHRRPCLFRETCSRHVYRVTREYGAFRGIAAFAKRFRRCRLGYVIEFDGQAGPFLRLADHSVAQPPELSESMAAFVEQSRLRGWDRCPEKNISALIANTTFGLKDCTRLYAQNVER